MSIRKGHNRDLDVVLLGRCVGCAGGCHTWTTFMLASSGGVRIDVAHLLAVLSC